MNRLVTILKKIYDRVLIRRVFLVMNKKTVLFLYGAMKTFSFLMCEDMVENQQQIFIFGLCEIKTRAIRYFNRKSMKIKIIKNVFEFSDGLV